LMMYFLTLRHIIEVNLKKMRSDRYLEPQGLRSDFEK
jgi:hypothetical protein